MKTLLFVFLSALASAQYFPPSGGGGSGPTGTCPQWQYIDALSSVAITCNPSGTDTGLGNGVVASGGSTDVSGYQASATGSNSTVHGALSNDAGGSANTVIGSFCIVDAIGGEVCIGVESEALGGHSVGINGVALSQDSIGILGIAGGVGDIALGINATTDTAGSEMAVGAGATCAGEYCGVWGYSSTGSAEDVNIFGSFSTGSGADSNIFGSHSGDAGFTCDVFGDGNTCTASNQFLMARDSTTDLYVGNPATLQEVTFHNPIAFGSLTGAGTLPVCAMADGTIYLGTNTTGVLGC